MKNIKTFLLCLIIYLITFLFGCGTISEEKYQLEQEEVIEYTYENVEAIITRIDTKYWFATTHRYEWDIEIYYEPYNLEFNEVSWANGAFSCPSFFNKSEGDFITVKVRNKYVNGQLQDRVIIRIK